MTTQPNPKYFAVAELIRGGKVSEANIAALREAIEDHDLAIFNSQRPEVNLRLGLRPTYLSGAVGHLGDKRGTKYEFFPKKGTHAYVRSNGDAWRISYGAFSRESQEVIEQQSELRYEGRYS